MQTPQDTMFENPYKMSTYIYRVFYVQKIASDVTK